MEDQRVARMWYAEGRVVKVQRGPHQDAHDAPIGMMDTPTLAQAVVVGHNAQVRSGDPERMAAPQPKAYEVGDDGKPTPEAAARIARETAERTAEPGWAEIKDAVSTIGEWAKRLGS